jgi:hypothetical protein
MKDAEQRELFRELMDYIGKRIDETIEKTERMIAAATSRIVGGNQRIDERLAELRARAGDNLTVDDVVARLTRIQELCEIDRRLERAPPVSVRMVVIISMLLGAAIFAAGMITVVLLRAAGCG